MKSASCIGQPSSAVYVLRLNLPLEIVNLCLAGATNGRELSRNASSGRSLRVRDRRAFRGKRRVCSSPEQLRDSRQRRSARRHYGRGDGRHGQLRVGARVLRFAVRTPLRRSLDQRLCRPVPVEPVRSRSPEAPRAEMAGTGAFCVRVCDGRFFPIARNMGVPPAQTCSSFCPATATKVYNGGSIDHAVAADGKRYAELSTAFVFREKIVQGCTCNGKDAFGLVNTPVEDDATLPPGDIVATNNGLMAYNGGGGTQARRELHADRLLFGPVDGAAAQADRNQDRAGRRHASAASAGRAGRHDRHHARQEQARSGREIAHDLLGERQRARSARATRCRTSGPGAAAHGAAARRS